MLGLLVGKLSPSGIHIKLLIFIATVYCSVVHVNDVLTLLAIRLDDEFLHLLHSKVYGDDFGDAEECALENSVCAVAKTYFLCNL